MRRKAGTRSTEKKPRVRVRSVSFPMSGSETASQALPSSSTPPAAAGDSPASSTRNLGRKNRTAVFAMARLAAAVP